MLHKIYEQMNHLWDDSVEEALKEYVRLPALSPDFDRDWEKNGILHESLMQAKAWAEKQGIVGLHCEIIQHPGFTPCLFVEIKAQNRPVSEGSVFLYGHLDKQPENHGWDEDKGPWKPVIQNGRLYGRGSVDDGYAFYTSLSAIKALQTLGIAHPRCVGLFETCEESASRHYEEYLEDCAQKIGNIGLVVALDSCSGDYDRLWVTDTLRGMIGGAIEVRTLTAGVHSGEASGIVPGSFMILRHLLDRIEDSRTGEIIPRVFHTGIPPEACEQTREVAQIEGDQIWKAYPWYGATEPLTKDPFEGLLNRNWRPELTVTGIDGIPSVENGGNVMRPFTRAKIGLRLPPDVDAQTASKEFGRIVTENPPFNADVHFEPVVASNGWVAPRRARWLKEAFSVSSETLWGEEPGFLGMGGSIPLLNVFTSRWPHAQYMVAGALGPGSNAHGPNESLHIEYCKKLISSVAYVIAKYED